MVFLCSSWVLSSTFPTGIVLAYLPRRAYTHSYEEWSLGILKVKQVVSYTFNINTERLTPTQQTTVLCDLNGPQAIYLHLMVYSTIGVISVSVCTKYIQHAAMRYHTTESKTQKIDFQLQIRLTVSPFEFTATYPYLLSITAH